MGKKLREEHFRDVTGQVGTGNEKKKTWGSVRKWRGQASMYVLRIEYKAAFYDGDSLSDS